MKYLLTFFLLFSLTSKIYGQNKNSSINRSQLILFNTLTDSIIGRKYVLQPSKLIITAYDKTGLPLWKTNLRHSLGLSSWQSDRVEVVRFEFTSDLKSRQIDAILVSFSNRQFGYLNKWTGEFKMGSLDY